MKNSTKRIAGFLLMAFTLMFAPLEIMASSEENDIAVLVKDDLIGGWEYTVAGAPEGYDKGLLMIIKQGDVYKAQVQLSGGAVNGENVVVKGNKITFTVNIEGETVSVALEAKGSKLSGTSTSPSNGTMTITGVKTLSAE
ncbi:hypothetical protein FEE95_00640 [Maribacter algarum]|uniref:Lipocalin-like domain-containing protein n=1 Tax=Maribacter algarum (ex Zhang et al. 2020) TaxID=2578118 RepID=A0A5S3PST3_9FLAO|nr:hypothetical protein [Maribacter algarum]TMM57968.1 hypothetical protein FEE95_00640 [Maribacter algarum]